MYRERLPANQKTQQLQQKNGLMIETGNLQEGNLQTEVLDKLIIKDMRMRTVERFQKAGMETPWGWHRLHALLLVPVNPCVPPSSCAVFGGACLSIGSPEANLT